MESHISFSKIGVIVRATIRLPTKNHIMYLLTPGFIWACERVINGRASKRKCEAYNNFNIIYMLKNILMAKISKAR
jgi:hypothetical protein